MKVSEDDLAWLYPGRDDLEIAKEWVANEVGGFNGEIKKAIELAVEDRKQRIFANHGRVASLGIPLKNI